MASAAAANPYLSAAKAADPVAAVLHPLVLLSISDQITRHSLRSIPGPVAGAILGQQNGRQITLEHTFDFGVEAVDGDVRLDAVWFCNRMEQLKLVHKDRNLDVVGWYTVLSHAGPTARVMQVHEALLQFCSESTNAVLLTLHPEDLREPAAGGRLPITLYETHYEQDELPLPATAAEDEEMKDAPAATQATVPASEPASTATSKAAGKHTDDATKPLIAFKLREIPYTVETQEAEMISIDFVARGAANASAADGKTSTRDSTSAGAGASTEAASASTSSSTSTPAAAPTPSATASADTSGRDHRAVPVESNRSKRRMVAVSGEPQQVPTTTTAATLETLETPATLAKVAADDDGSIGVSLPPEDEETIAALTSRANAIRMLHARLVLLAKYVESLPPEAADDLHTPDSPDTPSDSADAADADSLDADALPILRSIQALVHRLPLVVPPPVNGAFEAERERQANDVHLVSLLLDDMMKGIASVRRVGSKFDTIEYARTASRRAARHDGDAGSSAGDLSGVGMGGGGMVM